MKSYLHFDDDISFQYVEATLAITLLTVFLILYHLTMANFSHNQMVVQWHYVSKINKWSCDWRFYSDVICLSQCDVQTKGCSVVTYGVDWLLQSLQFNTPPTTLLGPQCSSGGGGVFFFERRVTACCIVAIVLMTLLSVCPSADFTLRSAWRV